MNFNDVDGKTKVGVNNSPTPEEGLDEKVPLPVGEKLIPTVGEKNTPTGSSKNSTIQYTQINTNKKQLKETNEILLLLNKFNFNEKTKNEIIEEYSLERIKNIFSHIEKQIKPIHDPEGFIISALRNNYEFSYHDKARKLAKEENQKANKDIEIKEEVQKQLENLKKKQVNERINSNPKHYQDMLDEEKVKLASSPILAKNEFMVEINTRVRVRKEIL